jgi:Pyruvate formate lyase.
MYYLKKGFSGIIKDAKAKLETLSLYIPEDIGKIDFYESVIHTSEGIITLAKRYSKEAENLASIEINSNRKMSL